MEHLIDCSNYTFMNTIFYKNKVLNHPEDVKCLEPFFYDSSIEILLPKTPEPKVPEPKVPEPKAPESEVPEPKAPEQKAPEPKAQQNKTESIKGNSIFWSIFIEIYGYVAYAQIGSRYSNSELDEKQKIISYLKSNSHLFKTGNNKITKAEIQEIYSEFMTLQSNTTLLGVIGLSIYYKAQILLVNKEKNVYYDIHHDNYERTIILIKNPRIHRKQVYELGDVEDIDLGSMFKMESIKRPLKAISNYKQSELQTIYETYFHKSNNPIGHMKKPELYSTIVEHCGVFV